MHPATAVMLSKAIQAEHRASAERRRHEAERKRSRQLEASKPRSWPLRVLRLGNAASRA